MRDTKGRFNFQILKTVSRPCKTAVDQGCLWFIAIAVTAVHGTYRGFPRSDSASAFLFDSSRCLVLFHRRPANDGRDPLRIFARPPRSMDKVAIGRLALTSREHIIPLEALDKGLTGDRVWYRSRHCGASRPLVAV